jgi:hypothetical protein
LTIITIDEAPAGPAMDALYKETDRLIAKLQASEQITVVDGLIERLESVKSRVVEGAFESRVWGIPCGVFETHV